MNLAYILCITSVVLFRRALTDQQPELISYRVEGLSGMHVDAQNKILRIYVETPILLRLFGRYLTPRTLMAIAPINSSCELLVAINGSATFQSSFVSDTVMLVAINIPKMMAGQEFIFCLSSDSGATWLDQGSSTWKLLRPIERLEAKGIMPLWGSILVVFLLIICSALFSGLNLGLMGLDNTELQLLLNIGNETEQRYAKTVMSVRKNENYLLCTFLFGNTLVNTLMTILLSDVLGSGIIGVVASTLFAVLIGEIIPQAVCSRNGLLIGAKTIWFTKFFMVITFPFSYPISKVLDYSIGGIKATVYNRDRLRELIRLTAGTTGLNNEEMNIIKGALNVTKKTAKDIMVALENAFMMDINRILDFNTMKAIVNTGFTRIPVYENEEENIVCLLNVKDLAFVDPDDKIKLSTLCRFYNRPIQYVHADTPLDKLLDQFKSGGCHMSMVQAMNKQTPGKPVLQVIGLVTLEDVIEEILQFEIKDEYDDFKADDDRQKMAEKDYSLFHTITDENCEHLPFHLEVATFNFLSTYVEPFKKDYISPTILHRLLRKNVVFRYSVSESPLSQTTLFTKGKPCDYFILILEGSVRVHIGKESLPLDGEQFSYYGVKGLLELEKAGSFTNLFGERSYGTAPSYAPDFTVIAVMDILYLRIRYAQYIAARRASLIEQASREMKPVTTSALEEVFTHEWLKATESQNDCL